MQLQSFFIILFLLLLSCISVFEYGSMGPFSAAFGDNAFFCAIDASGKQDVICWIKDTTLTSSSSASTSAYFSNFGPITALSGGEGLLCGVLANNSQVFCWSSVYSGLDLVPSVCKNTLILILRQERTMSVLLEDLNILIIIQARLIVGIISRVLVIV